MLLLTVYHCITPLTLLISSEASYVNPWDVVLDPSKALWSPSSRGTSSVGGTHASSKSTGSVSPADVHARDLEGEDPEVEIEPAFLLEAPSWSFEYVFIHYSPLQGIYTRRSHDLATLVTEDDHHSLEEEESGGDVGKEGVEAPDTSSAEFVVATLMVIPYVLTQALDRHQ